MAKKEIGPPVAPVAPVDDPALFVQPDIKVLDRRLQNPFGMASAPIDLKEPGWVVHIIDRRLRANRYYETLSRGWSPVHWNELKDQKQCDGFERSPEGYVVRGERQNEVLLKIPQSWWDRIVQAKSDLNTRHINNPNRQKRELVEATAGTLGPQAAEHMERRLVGEVIDKQERITRADGVE